MDSENHFLNEPIPTEQEVRDAFRMIERINVRLASVAYIYKTKLEQDYPDYWRIDLDTDVSDPGSIALYEEGGWGESERECFTVPIQYLWDDQAVADLIAKREAERADERQRDQLRRERMERETLRVLREKYG